MVLTTKEIDLINYLSAKRVKVANEVWKSEKFRLEYQNLDEPDLMKIKNPTAVKKKVGYVVPKDHDIKIKYPKRLLERLNNRLAYIEPFIVNNRLSAAFFKKEKELILNLKKKIENGI